MLDFARLAGVWRAAATSNRGASHGSSLPSHRKGPDGGPQRLTREQQDQAPVPAEPAASPLLGRDRESLGEPAAHERRSAYDRQEGHRRRPGGTARARRARLSQYERNHHAREDQA